MRRVAISVVLAALLLAATLGAARAASGPKLVVVTATPLVVVGTGFEPRERVTVTLVTLLGPRRQIARATVGGGFRVAFGRIGRPCARPLAVRARGSAGSSAVMRLAAPPCVPPPV